MGDPQDLLQYLWLVAQTLLICLLGVALVMLVRLSLRKRWRPPGGDGGSKRLARARRTDPWKESAQRLIMPMPPTDPKDRNDHEDRDETPDDTGP